MLYRRDVKKGRLQKVDTLIHMNKFTPTVLSCVNSVSCYEWLSQRNGFGLIEKPTVAACRSIVAYGNVKSSCCSKQKKLGLNLIFFGGT